MNRLFWILIVLIVPLLLSGCGNTGKFEEEIINLENQVTDLKNQVDSLEKEKSSISNDLEKYKKQAENKISSLEAEVKKYKKAEEERQKGNTTVGSDNKVVVGDIITVADYCEFNFNKIYFSSNVNLSNTSSVYSYVKGSGADYKYVIIKGNFKNINDSELEVEDVIKSVKAVYDGKYEYRGNAVNEGVDKSDFFGGVRPLMDSYFYIYAEVPRETESSDLPLMMKFEINNKVYTMDLK